MRVAANAGVRVFGSVVISPRGFGIAIVIHGAGGPSSSRSRKHIRFDMWSREDELRETSSLKTARQNVSFTPTWAAKGMPTVVPGPKKSPRAPAGTSNYLPLVTGTEHAGVGQSAVTLARLFTGTGRALILPT